jgi:hypothetical protein
MDIVQNLVLIKDFSFNQTVIGAITFRCRLEVKYVYINNEAPRQKLADCSFLSSARANKDLASALLLTLRRYD